MDESMKFVGKFMEGGRMSELCRAHGISRKTGYKIMDRYWLEGPAGLTDRSRARHSHPNAVSDEVKQLIYSSWCFVNMVFPERSGPITVRPFRTNDRPR